MRRAVQGWSSHLIILVVELDRRNGDRLQVQLIGAARREVMVGELSTLDPRGAELLLHLRRQARATQRRQGATPVEGVGLQAARVVDPQAAITAVEAGGLAVGLQAEDRGPQEDRHPTSLSLAQVVEEERHLLPHPLGLEVEVFSLLCRQEEVTLGTVG